MLAAQIGQVAASGKAGAINGSVFPWQLPAGGSRLFGAVAGVMGISVLQFLVATVGRLFAQSLGRIRRW
ncbi:hypothetical protein PSCICL_39760 [Pseudomonas cichorii]|nr:hypothetical protein PSCICL_39760 [Pseudomonas cichorii]